MRKFTQKEEAAIQKRIEQWVISSDDNLLEISMNYKNEIECLRFSNILFEKDDMEEITEHHTFNELFKKLVKNIIHQETINGEKNNLTDDEIDEIYVEILYLEDDGDYTVYREFIHPFTIERNPALVQPNQKPVPAHSHGEATSNGLAKTIIDYLNNQSKSSEPINYDDVAVTFGLSFNELVETLNFKSKEENGKTFIYDLNDNCVSVVTENGTYHYDAITGDRIFNFSFDY
ncbi:hypothetical protein [Leeuwenhoekiella sp. NPDC079379]|uniref:hypothetical protein n=1 Tax=Leeuwenhoekiella sp. NPDC079379 TaxID=3364122 RepID=UPI0037C5E4B5